MEGWQKSLQEHPHDPEVAYDVGVAAAEHGDKKSRHCQSWRGAPLATGPLGRPSAVGRTAHGNGRGWDCLAAVASGAGATPGDLVATNAVAWIFATCPDARYRHGPEAVKIAEEAGADFAEPQRGGAGHAGGSVRRGGPIREGPGDGPTGTGPGRIAGRQAARRRLANPRQILPGRQTVAGCTARQALILGLVDLLADFAFRSCEHRILKTAPSAGDRKNSTAFSCVSIFLKGPGLVEEPDRRRLLGQGQLQILEGPLRLVVGDQDHGEGVQAWFPGGRTWRSSCRSVRGPRSARFSAGRGSRSGYCRPSRRADSWRGFRDRFFPHRGTAPRPSGSWRGRPAGEWASVCQVGLRRPFPASSSCSGWPPAEKPPGQPRGRSPPAASFHRSARPSGCCLVDLPVGGMELSPRGLRPEHPGPADRIHGRNVDGIWIILPTRINRLRRRPLCARFNFLPTEPTGGRRRKKSTAKKWPNSSAPNPFALMQFRLDGKTAPVDNSAQLSKRLTLSTLCGPPRLRFPS